MLYLNTFDLVSVGTQIPDPKILVTHPQIDQIKHVYLTALTAQKPASQLDHSDKQLSADGSIALCNFIFLSVVLQLLTTWAGWRLPAK